MERLAALVRWCHSQLHRGHFVQGYVLDGFVAAENDR
jgi:hypothetical protein